MIRYTLSDYILTITLPTNLSSKLSLSEENPSLITIGGEGSYLDSISVLRNTNMWDTKADATGSWVHTRSLDKTGSCKVSVNMLSEAATRLKQIHSFYDPATADYDGMTLEIHDKGGETIVTMVDCYIVKMPEYSYSGEPSNLEFEFTCGEVNYH